MILSEIINLLIELTNNNPEYNDYDVMIWDSEENVEYSISGVQLDQGGKEQIIIVHI